VTTLIENNKVNDIRGLATENGLSLCIERPGQTILFDTGGSDNFIRNAEKLGEEIRNVDIVVISHAHMDHIGGLPYFLGMNDKANVYMSKNAQKSPESKALFSKMEAEYSDRIQFVDVFTEIAKGAYILTEIKGTESIRGHVDHEIVLVLKDRSGLTLFTGCSHGGILNILEAVAKKFPKIYIKGVFGGFHLAGLSFNNGKNEYVERIGKRMQTYPIIKIYTGHCTGIRAYLILKSVLGGKLEYLATGFKVDLF
jgi:7,8-dihydropterin-6-yl-methyl-4-(beta-D-ribofuranosyl)aminobenzene 5'-phosphate synthase